VADLCKGRLPSHGLRAEDRSLKRRGRFTSTARNLNVMSDSILSSVYLSTDAVQRLGAALQATDAALVHALLVSLEPMEVLWSLKEVDTGRYVHVNSRMAEVLGRPAGELVGLTDEELLLPSARVLLRNAEKMAMAHALPSHSQHQLEVRGHRREFSVTRIRVLHINGALPTHLLSLWVENTAALLRESRLRQALAQIEQQQGVLEQLRRDTQEVSQRDGATGLFHADHFEDQLRREVDLSAREHREFALVCIGLNPFAESVKALGTKAEARVLETLGRLLRGNTRAMDISCRLDESRFALLLSGVGLATAHSRMESLRRQCATQIVVLDGHELGFTVSMGVASFPHTAQTQEGLMEASNLALEEAQKRGTSQVALASIRFEMVTPH
jgi:diguanylate cyclase (GGDEF)-like protein